MTEEGLARELWEAHATDHQTVIPLAQLHWDEVDVFTRDHWRHLARTALAFTGRYNMPADPRRARLSAAAAALLDAILSQADLSALKGDTAVATLDEAFAVTAALGALNRPARWLE